MCGIIQKFKQQFPEIYPTDIEKDSYATYSVLHYFGTYCAQHFEDEKTMEILKTVNEIYKQKDLFNCNAIENEFLYTLANQLGVNNLIIQLPKIPENLWAKYIKIIIENQKTLLS